MELQSSLKPSAGSSVTRRVWLVAPLAVATGGVWLLTRQQRLPDPAQNGAGEIVKLVLFNDNGERTGEIQTRKLKKSEAEWRKQLGAESFAITRKQATEFAFHNAYWNSERPGIYRCICCGNALFSSKDKFDSGTGWPSFILPVAGENIYTKPDRSLGFERIEVLCRKCDAHLGHLFDDGPPPTHNRYCLNSAALQLFSDK